MREGLETIILVTVVVGSVLNMDSRPKVLSQRLISISDPLPCYSVFVEQRFQSSTGLWCDSREWCCENVIEISWGGFSDGEEFNSVCNFVVCRCTQNTL